MKKIIFIIFVIQCNALIGQISSVHKPLKGDKLKKLPYHSLSEIKKDSVWNFSGLRRLGNEELFAYDSVLETESFILKSNCQNNYLILNDDSLWMSGFSNKLMKIKYESPLLINTFCNQNNDTLINKFVAKGTFCNYLPLNLEGISETYVLDKGDLILPDKQRYNNTICVLNKEEMHDSLGLSIRKQEMKWFSDSDKYHLFEYVKIDLIKYDSIINHSTYSYLIKLDDETHNREAERKSRAENNIVESDSVKILVDDLMDIYPMTSCKFYPNPVVSALNIDFFMENPGIVEFMIHDIHGFEYIKSTSKKFQEGKYNIQLYLDRCPPGVYLLYIKVNDVIKMKNIIKQ